MHIFFSGLPVKSNLPRFIPLSPRKKQELDFYIAPMSQRKQSDLFSIASTGIVVFRSQFVFFVFAFGDRLMQSGRLVRYFLFHDIKPCPCFRRILLCVPLSSFYSTVQILLIT